MVPESILEGRFLAVQGGELPGNLADANQQRGVAVKPGGIQIGAALPPASTGQLIIPILDSSVAASMLCGRERKRDGFTVDGRSG